MHTRFCLGVAIIGRGRVNGKDKGGQIWSMYLTQLYKNRTMKLVKIVLRKRG
jgi:hypothetical protein